MKKNLERQRCPNRLCRYYNKIYQGNIKIHDYKYKRYRCKNCGKTWVSHCEEFYYRIKKDPIKIRRSRELLSAGFSIRKSAELVDVSPSTILRWKKKNIISL